MKLQWSHTNTTSSARVEGIDIVILGTNLKATYELKMIHDGYRVSATLVFEISVTDRDDDAATAIEILQGVASKIGGGRGT